MRKLQILILIVIVGFLLAIWSPWNNFDLSLAKLFGVEPPPESSGLYVSSLAGEIEIYIDNDLKGTAKADPERIFIFPGIEPGEHHVRLVRVSEVESAFYEFDRLLSFVAGADVVIAYELGPTEDFSEGHIISVTRNADISADTYLNISSVPTEARVLIDGISAGSTPITLFPIDLDKQISVTLQKDGYETQSFTILPDTQEDREKLKGFTLDIEASMFLRPIRVIE